MTNGQAQVPAFASRQERIRRYRSTAKKTFLTVITIAAAGLGSYFALIEASDSDVVIGPVRIGFSLRQSWHGKTVVEIPPAGSIEADTHKGPLVAEFTVKEIAVSDIDELTDPFSPARQTLENWQAPFREQLVGLIVKIIAAAVLTGAAIAVLLRRTIKWGLTGAAAGLAVAVLVTGFSYLTFDTDAFSETRYSGSIDYAPEILAFSEETLANLDAYKNRLPEIAESLYMTVSELHRLPPSIANAGDIRILHVSDMHNSTAAAALVKKTATLYNAAFIIDTGDLTELGLPFEAKYPASYLPLPVPYLWIAGNHDTPAITEAMKPMPGVRVINNDFITTDGIRVGGFSDPAAASLSPNPVSDDMMAGEAARVADAVDGQPQKPFIVAVHDPKQGMRLAGKVPVVLNGHTHRQSITVKEGTIFLDAGTTGAGGFRGFEMGRESPGSLFVLYVQKEPLKLVAVDAISIYGFSQEFSVTRRVFGAEEGIYHELEAGLPVT